VFQSAKNKVETMRVRRLDYVLLAMPAGGETDARNFYSGILGIPRPKNLPELAGRGGCWFEDGELKVHLGVEKNFAPARKGSPGFPRRGPCGIGTTDLCPRSLRQPDELLEVKTSSRALTQTRLCRQDSFGKSHFGKPHFSSLTSDRLLS